MIQPRPEGLRETRMNIIGMMRLANQQILHPTAPTAAEVVSRLGAIQGQDYPGAKWSIGLRLPGSTDAQIEQALADLQIVRTWAMRGTLFLVAAPDLRWITDLLAERQIAGYATRYSQLELDEPTMTRANDIFVRALAGGQHLSRSELFTALELNGISPAGQRGVYMLQRAALDGLIVQSVMQRRDTTFRRIDEALPGLKSKPRDESLAELARRYFTTRGPVTLADFTWWSGLSAAEAREALALIRSELVEETIDGRRYWLPPGQATVSDVAGPIVHALPGFDEFVLGYKDRSAALDRQFADRICPGGNGVFYPTIVVNGQIVGTWKRENKKKAVSISVEPFTSLTAAEYAAFTDAIQPFGAFLGLPPVMAGV
jgi:hypothetical protein